MESLAVSEDETARLHGVVKFFDDAKGFGFVRRDDGDKDVFVHISDLRDSGVKDLGDGDKVSFTVVDGRKGLKAVEIRVEP